MTRGARVPHNRTALLQLLGRLYDPRTNYRDIEKLLVGELGLSVQLLRLASSVAYGGGALVSVAHAVSRLGTAQVAGLVLLLVVAGFDDKPIELVLSRARAREAVRGARADGEAARRRAVHGRPAVAARCAARHAARDDCRAAACHDLIRDVVLARGSDAPTKISRSRARRARATSIRSRAPATRRRPVFTVWYDAVRWSDEIVRTLGRT